MTKYITSRIVDAIPCTQASYLGELQVPPVEGYLIEDKDFGDSWVPKAHFDYFYRPLEGLTIGFAIEALKRGYPIKRKCWKDHEKLITLPIVGHKHMVITTLNKGFVPWTAKQEDLLAEDWEVCT